MSSDVEEEEQQQQGDEKPFAAERAKTGRAKCKRCKCAIEKGEIRIGKYVTSFFADGKLMPAWHHVTCLFEAFAKQRATTKRIDDPAEDVKGWEQLSDDDRKLILDKLEEFEKSYPTKISKKKTASPRKTAPSSSSSSGKTSEKKKKETTTDDKEKDKEERGKISSKDDSFREFRRVCGNIASVDAYTDKTAIIKRMFTRGMQGDGFKGDIVLWCKLLLPGAVKRIYNLQSKQLIKLFARMLLQDEDAMLEHLEQGDVAETIGVFFENSDVVSPCTASLLTIQDVDLFLEGLSRLTKEEEQIQHFRSILDRCTSNDLKMIVRLIKHDLRINAGPKHILEGLHVDAYKAFQMSRDLEAVIHRFLPDSEEKASNTSDSPSNRNKVAISLMTPVLPMLAEACTSVAMAMRKCPNGMLSEVKYDGERVQVHKSGNDFRYFSRSLKPVLPHKVNLFKDYIARAFPDGDDLILDSEVLMVDNETGQPLPFGTLGIHKKAEFKNANVCLFVFDCLYYNGEILMNKPMLERRRILKDRMTEIPSRIMLSEIHEVHDPRALAERIVYVLKLGLEGLVLKDIDSKYEPGKRHWLKVKKDYLCGGAMADSADLVVLGAWYGTGNKGGILSIFLMGCYDEERDKWLTVTKVHTGHDDTTLAELQDQLDMVKIGKDVEKLPSWLHANKPMVPDFVARDPKKQPVWEITGAEFTNQGVHTADGISVRFPRVTRIRRDKDWSTATSLNELRGLFKKKPDSVDFSHLLATLADVDDIPRKRSPDPATSPRKFEKKARKITSSLDEPSTSFKIEDVSEESFEKQKRDKRDEELDSIADIQPRSKKLKVSKIETERSNNVLKDVRASLAPSLDKSRRKDVQRMLKKLGGTIVTENRPDSTTTHVIHTRTEIPSTAVLVDFADFPRTVKHVNVSWLEESATRSAKQDEICHAVQLIGDYCDCPCVCIDKRRRSTS
ncbi:DNA ligase 3 isoform X2 [Polyergus mexicanus]|uniref:DNA ligase 3 isoform X2 n=1 Tax=Polyergus mexicanus TaxID=615972 RepID=UPI0038B498B7